MNAPVDLITVEEVRAVVLEGEIIENYPEDVRGHSCLMLDLSVLGRPIHVVCSPKEDNWRLSRSICRMSAVGRPIGRREGLGNSGL